MKKNKIIISVQKAKAEDLKIHKVKYNSSLREVQEFYVRKIGLMYFLKSYNTDKFDGPYTLTKDTDLKELSNYLRKEMIYIPISALDNNIVIKE